MARADVAVAAGDLTRAHALIDATAEPASKHPEALLNHKLGAARLALRERKPGTHAAIVRDIVEYPKFGWSHRVDALLLLREVERRRKP